MATEACQGLKCIRRAWQCFWVSLLPPIRHQTAIQFSSVKHMKARVLLVRAVSCAVTVTVAPCAYETSAPVTLISTGRVSEKYLWQGSCVSKAC